MQTDRQTNTHIQTDRHNKKRQAETDKQTYKKTHAYKQTDRQTKRQSDI